jgi:hypothetical protein
VYSLKERNAFRKKFPLSTRLGDLKGQFHEKNDGVFYPGLRRTENKFEFTKRIPLGSFQIF